MFRPFLFTSTLAVIFGTFAGSQAASAQTVEEFSITGSGTLVSEPVVQELKGNRQARYFQVVGGGDGTPVGPYTSFSNVVQINSPSGAVAYSEVTLTSIDHPEDSLTLFIEQSRKRNETTFTGVFAILGGTGLYEGAWGYGETFLDATEGVTTQQGFIVY